MDSPLPRPSPIALVTNRYRTRDDTPSGLQYIPYSPSQWPWHHSPRDRRLFPKCTLHFRWNIAQWGISQDTERWVKEYSLCSLSKGVWCLLRNWLDLCTSPDYQLLLHARELATWSDLWMCFYLVCEAQERSRKLQDLALAVHVLFLRNVSTELIEWTFEQFGTSLL